MSEAHDPFNFKKPESDPHIPTPGGAPAGDELEEFDLLAEDDPSGDVFIDLSEEVPEHEPTLNLSEIPEEPSRPQMPRIQPTPISMDEPQSMILEPDPEFDLVEDLQMLEEAPAADAVSGVAFDLPAVEEPQDDADGAVAFDLPSHDDQSAEKTRGVSHEELDFLMEEAVPQSEMSDAADLGGAVPMAEAASGVSGFIPDAEPASFAGLPEDAAAAILGEEDAELGEAVPMAESASFTGDPEMPSQDEPAEDRTVLESPLWAEAATGSSPDFTLPETFSPVQPASDWFHSSEATTELTAEGPAPLQRAAADDGDIFEESLPREHEGSDIFGWKKPSDVPLFGEAPPALPGDSRPTPSALIRESLADSARHQGRTEPSPEEIDTGAMPRASDEASSILGELGGSKSAIDLDGSEVRLEDPGVERTLSDDDVIPEFDLELDPGTPTFNTPDDPPIELLADPPLASDGSEVPFAQQPSPSSAGRPDEWFASPGSDLFAERKVPEDDSDGRVDPFAADIDTDQPSLSTAASSIFTGQKPPADSITGGSASVRIGHNDEEQTVFDQFMGDDEDASHILGARAERNPKPGSDSTQEDEKDVDWLASDPSEIADAYDDMRDAPASGIFSKTSLPPVDASPSSIFTKGNLDPADRDRANERTREMDSASNLADAYGLPNTKPSEVDLGSKPTNDPPSEVEVDWLAGTDEPEPISPVSSMPAFAMVEDRGPRSSQDDFEVEEDESTDERPTPRVMREKPKAGSNKGALVGGIAGLLGGIAVSAGIYFAGLVPNSDKTDTPVQTAKADPKKDAETAQQIQDLETARADAEKGLQEAKDQVIKASQDLAKIQEDKIGLEVAVKVAEQNTKEATDKLAALEKTAKDATDKLTDAMAKATVADGELAKMTKAFEEAKVTREMIDKSLVDLTRANTKVKSLTETLDGITKQLQDGKLLPADAADPAAVAVAVKSAIAKATSMPGPAGAGLTAAEVQELKDRVAKSETAAKAAADKLAADTTAIKTDYTAQLEDLKKAHAEQVKKLTDGNPDLAKLQDELKKAQDATAAEVKKAQDAAATDYATKLDDLKKAHAEQVKKLTDGNPDLAKMQDELKKAQDATAAEVKKAQDAAATDYSTKLDDLKKAHAEQVKKLTDGNPDLAKLQDELKKAQDATAAEVKKAQESMMAEVKKAQDAAAEDVKKAQDLLAAEQKKTLDASALALKELTDKYNADAAKLREDADAKLLAAQKKAAEDVNKAEAELTAMKADLAGVMTPSQALDLYLPLLGEARRPADADAASAAADKVLASAAPGTEAYAKAQTVKGLAHLIKGNEPAARTAFDAARKDPSYAAAKPWARFAEEGTKSLTDPLAKFRKPVDIDRKDPRAAVRFLDEGIRAYSARRYADAEKLLAQAVSNDATSPVAWYYLGAARWQTGRQDAAREDFRQGAEREHQRVMSAASVEQAIAAIQGPVRAAISDARP